MEILSRYSMKETEAVYVKQGEIVSLFLLTVGEEIKEQTLKDKKPEPLFQMRLRGDDHPGGYAGGLTMRGSSCMKKLKYVQQKRTGNIVETVFSGEGYQVTHELTLKPELDVCLSRVRFVNTSAMPITLEMLSSFALGQLSPYVTNPGKLRIHRLQSYWSAEGRLRTDDIYSLHLERSWLDFAVRCEHFGTRGSMPVREWFPFCAIEDPELGYTWGVQLYHPASWQMELCMQDDGLSISGGLADRMSGDWYKQVKPGEDFESPVAAMAVCRGDLDAIGCRLTALQRETFLQGPESEKSLPVIFNEYCTTWGNPTEELIKKAADRLKGLGVGYFVIDSGWYSHVNWSSCMGDWQEDPVMFPHGLKAAADYIGSCGMIPGLWYEFENCAPDSKAWQQEDLLLKQDGIPITSGDRRYRDMLKEENKAYLNEHVIGLLKKSGFGYIKVDYNSPIPGSIDGEESGGENLRRHMAEGSQAFFKRMRQEIPDLVIENCASGGHRLEPSMMALCSMASFSDAHECDCIPLIAANLHRVIHPCQSQIWAVLRAGADNEQLYWRLISGFLGRLCLSGDIHDLSGEQWQITKEAVTLYKRVSELILWGSSQRFGCMNDSYRAPRGWQGLLRTTEDRALYILHSFGGEEKAYLPQGYCATESFGSAQITLNGGEILLPMQGMHAKLWLLKKETAAE